jgi:hypothetical protein
MLPAGPGIETFSTCATFSTSPLKAPIESMNARASGTDIAWRGGVPMDAI